MGCWGTGVGSDDQFWDLISHVQTEMGWDKYDGNPETMITDDYFNEHYECIERKINEGLNSGFGMENYKSCWFQMVAFLVMKIGARMSMEMRQVCMRACRIENDYLETDAWMKRSDLEERIQALEKFALEIDNYYCSES